MTKEPTFTLGIDPGLQGALAIFHVVPPSGQDRPARIPTQIYDMPINSRGVDGVALAQLIKSVLDIASPGAHITAAVEQVHSLPRQAGAFNFGYGAGVVRGVLDACGIPVTMIPPAVWKGRMHLLKAPSETCAQAKDHSREMASLLLPEVKHLFTRKKDDGRAEAALIAIAHAMALC